MTIALRCSASAASGAGATAVTAGAPGEASAGFDDAGRVAGEPVAVAVAGAGGELGGPDRPPHAASPTSPRSAITLREPMDAAYGQKAMTASLVSSSTGDPSGGGPRRLVALDWMRGLVMVLMAVDHSSEQFNAGRLFTDSALFYPPGTPLPAGQFLTRW